MKHQQEIGILLVIIFGYEKPILPAIMLSNRSSYIWSNKWAFYCQPFLKLGVPEWHDQVILAIIMQMKTTATQQQQNGWNIIIVP